MQYDQHVILKHLDKPVRILAFSIHEIILYALPFFIGSLVDSLLIIPVLGFLIIFFCRKILSKLPRFYVIRFLYWHLPSRQYNKLMKTNLIHSHRRLWIKR